MQSSVKKNPTIAKPPNFPIRQGITKTHSRTPQAERNYPADQCGSNRHNLISTSPQRPV
ncbi:hypothetical protein HOY82DRAFT_580178 [Tuber indicum]|nr:hypothetical protein HOY82DRAFT_580178 [Tuber indicum]